MTLVEKFDTLQIKSKVDLKPEEEAFLKKEQSYLNSVYLHLNYMATWYAKLEKELKQNGMKCKADTPFHYRYRYFSPDESLKEIPRHKKSLADDFTESIVKFISTAYGLDFDKKAVKPSDDYQVVLQNIIAVLGADFKTAKMDAWKSKLLAQFKKVSVEESGQYLTIRGLSLVRRGRGYEYCGFYEVEILFQGLQYLHTGDMVPNDSLKSMWPSGEKIDKWPSTVKINFGGVRSITSDRETHAFEFEGDEAKNRFKELFQLHV